MASRAVVHHSLVIVDREAETVGASRSKVPAPSAKPNEISALVGVLAFALMYVATDALALPRVFYLLLDNRLVIARRVAGPALGYPGACLSATLVALVVATVARVTAPRSSARGVRTALAWLTIVAVVASLGYFVWTD